MSKVSKAIPGNTQEQDYEIILPTALAGVPSPYFTLAEYYRDKGKLNEARRLLNFIDTQHWQNEDAKKLIHELFELELAELKGENLRLRLKLLELSEPNVLPPKGKDLFKEIIDNLTSNQNNHERESNLNNHSKGESLLTFSFNKTQNQPAKKPKGDEISMEKPMKLHS